MEYPPCFYRVSTKALIYKDNKILLILESDGRWELPGGGLEVGEPFEVGIKREVKEELGVNAVTVSKEPVYSWSLVNEGKPRLLLCFKVETDSFDFIGNPEESEKIEFFTKEEMPALNLHPNIKELLNRIA